MNDILVNLPPTTVYRLNQLVELAGSLFRRKDQLQRFRSYVIGLLIAQPRKAIESMAQVVGVDSQALQHLVSHSSWDPFALMELLWSQRQADEGIWLVHEIAIPKKGQHSIGVHRQWARHLEKKINCQIGIFISKKIGSFIVPIAAQLYVPPMWYRERAELIERQIPATARTIQTKAGLAVDLLSRIVARNVRIRLAAEPLFVQAVEFQEYLNSQGSELVEFSETDWAQLQVTVDDWRQNLGLDHFEGRTWLGWHRHVSLVFAAHYCAASAT